MREKLLQIQVFFEIATAIGNHLDERQMLREALIAYLRKLNCAAGAVFRFSQSDDGSPFLPVFSIPRTAEHTPGWSAALSHLPDPSDIYRIYAFTQSLPLVVTDDAGHFFHFFSLPDYGLLLLIQNREALPSSIIQSLKPLNLKLARSGMACVQNREIERMNDRLSHEVDQRRRAENALRVLADGLEDRVADRTRELEQANTRLRKEIQERYAAECERQALEDRLAHSQKMEALGLLAGGVAHDLNNILSGIVGYPDLLLRQLPKDSPIEEPIRFIQKSGKKAAAIVQDLLTLARRGVTGREPVALNGMITEYLSSPEYRKLEEFHPQMALETRLARDLSTVSGSPIHLRKTLMNLVSNAAEARGKRIRVSTANRYLEAAVDGCRESRKGNFAVMTVTDDGDGIALEEQERIFEPFYTKKVMGRSGTGLGMAVVWGAVKDHDGFIHLQSAPGSGTRIDIYLPASREAPPLITGNLNRTIRRGNGERVMVVDDVPEQRHIAEAMLLWLGYTVQTASSGEIAMERIQEKNVDIVLLDMIMDPGIDGLETYLRLKETSPSTRCIIASGYAETGKVRAAMDAGACGFLRKPYTLDQLADMLADCFIK